jgi:hypothetical protein
MKPKWTVLVVAVVLALLTATTAQAITFGEPDGDRHPNVGFMIAQFPDGSLQPRCSGTLIAPTVFLTAAHCVRWMAVSGVGTHDVFVSFDPVFDENAVLHRGTYYDNPSYGHDQGDAHDVAVIVLDEALNIRPATLPPPGLLDQMKQGGTLAGMQFVTAGYGMERNDKTGGPHSIGAYGERQYAVETFLALLPAWIQSSMNPSTGNGGTCFGDSGGPHFLGDSNMVVAVTSRGDAVCRALDTAYRLDIGSARDYLGQFVTLP